MEHSGECKSAFLRGFFDSEASIAENGMIKVYNSDLRLLGYVRRLLSSLGIETNGPRLNTKHGTPLKDPRNGRTYYTKKDAYCLYVPSSYRLTFYKHVVFTIRRKQRRLEQYLLGEVC
ncbi:MAG: LAGLIDADG family homing endonuclease [Candidatus Caldarchaeum sp.]